MKFVGLINVLTLFFSPKREREVAAASLAKAFSQALPSISMKLQLILM